MNRGRRPRWFERRTLRFRLLASTVGLVTIACVVLGLVTALALHAFLIGQLDRRLDDAGNRFLSAHDHDRDPPSADDKGFGDSRGQAEGTLGVRLVAGRIAGIGIVGQATVPSLPSSTVGVLAALPIGINVSRDLGPLGDYRLLSAREPNGDTVVTGLPLQPVTDTMSDVILIELIGSAALIAISISAGYGLIKLSLRPLDRVTATARAVRDASVAGDEPLAHRVPTPVPGTEVGQLGLTFNHMLDHVELSFAARTASEHRLRRFIADASHELRTPVASIRAHAESVRRGDEPLPPAVALALQRIESEALRMGVLVDDLLLLARLDAGRPLVSEAVDVTRLVMDAVDDARAAFSKQRWRLSLPDAPVLVLGDSHRLHQVIANLLTNAGKHTPSGCTVSAEVTATDREVTVTVSDDGPGIPADRQPMLFERFYRADTTEGGSGLGLAIADAVVRAHRGQVSVDSRPGRTIFTVRLPRSASDIPAQEEEETPADQNVP